MAGALSDGWIPLNVDIESVTYNYVQIELDSRVANHGLVLTPQGTGEFIVGAPPDGTATGGNARGDNAVDLQMVRNAAADVASGTRSMVAASYWSKATGNQAVSIGGYSQTASGNNSGVYSSRSSTASTDESACLGGAALTVSGTQSAIVGGQSSVNAGQYSAIAGGFQASISGGVQNGFIGGGLRCALDNASSDGSAIIGGADCTVSAGYSAVIGGTRGSVDANASVVLGGEDNDINVANSVICGGLFNTINVGAAYSVILGGAWNYALNGGPYSTVVGISGASHHPCTIVLSGNSIGTQAEAGQSQAELLHFDQRTTNDTQTAMDSYNTEFTVPTNSGWTLLGRLVAWNESTAEIGQWNIDMLVKNNAGTVTIVAGGKAAAAQDAGDAAGWLLDTAVSGTTLRFLVTGIAAENIRWSLTLTASRAST